MKVLVGGHEYLLCNLDGDGDSHTELRFVKREGEKFPGNVGHHEGTTTQEVIRALIDRTCYVHSQIEFPENLVVIANLRQALWLLEARAARTHGRFLTVSPDQIELIATCNKCGHVECQEHEQERSKR